MRAKMMGVLVASMACLVAVPAMADEGGKGHGDKPSFPMPAAAFKQRVEAKQGNRTAIDVLTS